MAGGTGRMRRKGALATKTCLACGLELAWRKKWARDWDQVKYCSERCRRNKPGTAEPRGADA